MGGGGAHGGTTYKGYTIPRNKRWHTVAGKGLCAVMWYACAPPCSPFHPTTPIRPFSPNPVASLRFKAACLDAAAREIRPRRWASARVDQEMLGNSSF
jgi:hypothetical protein